MTADADKTGYGLFWLTLAVGSMCYQRSFPFNMGWWSFVFPLGVFILATYTIGNEIPSKFFKIVGIVSTDRSKLLPILRHQSSDESSEGWKGRDRNWLTKAGRNLYPHIIMVHRSWKHDLSFIYGEGFQNALAKKAGAWVSEGDE